MVKKIFLSLILASSGLLPVSAEKMALSDGAWLYRLTGAPASIPGEGEIFLPSTLDASHKSIFTPQGDNTTQLRREFSFSGAARYSRKIEIPPSWEGKEITLFLERTKPASIFIDGTKAGSGSRISSPQKYDLSSFLTPGKHTLEIEVNNADSIPPLVASYSNAVSESTQTNWNGILGNICLEARNPFNISGVRIDDTSFPEKVTATVNFSRSASGFLTLQCFLNGHKFSSEKIPPSASSVEVSLPVSSKDAWSPSEPLLHTLSFKIIDAKGTPLDDFSLSTGFRKFSTLTDYFTLNDNPIFLRGTVNSAVFPLSGYAPLDEESWKDYFSILKEYGINHVRFHSWTPPEAAFAAADKLGVLLLVELPIWGELDRDLKLTNRFLREELAGIMQAYSHHPSFVMFSTGNELWGDVSLMGEYMREARALNPRILSTYGSNIYLGMNGEIGEEDFIISSKTSDKEENSVRGSVSFADSSSGGFFNSTYPNSSFNFSDATEGLSVPLVSHEVGQYQSYPDFSEIEKYRGNLKPDNLLEFRKRAEEAGTLRKSRQYLDASGKWASKLYKAEMELALRSPGIGGFQLFGLEDYPGQGTAIVGILNPFMQSKGFISPEEWKKSADDVALLAEFPRFAFWEGELVEIPVLTVNFTQNPDTVTNIQWSAGFAEGSLPATPGIGVIDNEPLMLKLPRISEPRKITLSLKSGEVSNSYDFWVYPKKTDEIPEVSVTNNLTEALLLLEQGAKVILTPDSVTVAKASLEPLFTPDFWNYRMYRSICDEMNLPPSPGTLGLFINDSHPALKKFPTDNHTDWQWYPIIANSRPLIIDRLPKDFDPIVEVIDNVERNFRLSLMMECNVGKGKLVILSTDIEKASEYPEGRWLLQSVKEYMAGKDFKPAITLSTDQLVNLLTKPSNARLIKELKNQTYRKFT